MNTSSRQGRRRFWLVGLLGLLLLLAATTLIAQGGGARRGSWMTTDFQVINLDPLASSLAARFYAPDGSLRYSIDDTLPGGEGRAYEPSTMPTPLPESFTGTLALDSSGQVAAAVVHLEGVSDTERLGNTVFDVPADSQVGASAFAPIDGCTELYIQAFSNTTTVLVQVYGLDGSAPGLPLSHGILPNGLLVINPAVEMGLGRHFAGTVEVSADQPVAVTVVSTCGGLASFAAPPQGNTLLYAPDVPSFTVRLVTSTLFMQNTADVTATVAVSYSQGFTARAEIPPHGGVILSSPFGVQPGFQIYLPLVVKATLGSRMAASAADGSHPAALEQSALISSSQPLVVVIRSQSTLPGTEGSLAYRAFGQQEPSMAVALPVLFSGDQGWETGGRLWIRNLGAEPAHVKMRFISVPGGTIAWQSTIIGGGRVQRVWVPYQPPRSAAILLADQPIVAVTGAVNRALPLHDRHILYRGVNFDLTCQPIALAGPTWTPPTPTVGTTVTFTVIPLGTPPHNVAWDFGDGTRGSGALTSHTYMAAGQYTVIVSGTNCLGFYSAIVSGQITVLPPLLSSAYAGMADIGAPSVDLIDVTRDYYGWNSHLVIQNQAAAPINAGLRIYSGTAELYSTVQPVPPFGLWAVDLISITQLPALSNGYAVFSNTGASGPIAAVDNDFSPAAAIAQESSPGGSYNLQCPLLCQDPNHWSSVLLIRNVGGQLASVVVNYSDGTNASQLIPVGSTFAFNQATEPHNMHCFAAGVSADSPLLGLVIMTNQIGGVMSYNAFSGGGMLAYVPYVVSEPGGWGSTVYMLSVAGYPTDVTISYPGYPLATHTTVVPSIGFLAITTTEELGLPANFQGSMIITSSSYPIFTMVALHNPSRTGDPYAAYNSSSMPAASVYFPYVPKAVREEGVSWNASLSVQNASASPANVWLYFYDQAGNSFSPPVLRPGLGNPFTLAPGAMERISMADITALPPGVYSSYAFGSQPLVGMVQLGGTPGGTLSRPEVKGMGGRR